MFPGLILVCTNCRIPLIIHFVIGLCVDPTYTFQPGGILHDISLAIDVVISALNSKLIALLVSVKLGNFEEYADN